MLALCLRLILAAAGAALIITSAHAGGIYVLEDTIEIGRGQGRQFMPGEDVTVSFQMNDYEFGSADYKYAFFAVTPKRASLTQLTRSNISKWQTFYSLLKTPNRDRNDSSLDGPKRLVFTFPAPSEIGEYDIVYHRFPAFFGSRARPTDIVDELTEFEPAEFPKLTTEMLRYADGFVKLVDFNVGREAAPRNMLTVYMRANGVPPGAGKIQGGLVEKPLEITWHAGPEFKGDPKKVLFRYKMWPSDEDWSAWTYETSVKYHFLPKGFLSIYVEAMYDDGRQKLTSEPARFTFALDKHLVARPSRETFNKGPTAKPFERSGQYVVPNIAFDKVYSRSRALLIGLYQFDDKKSFAEFGEDKIRNDVDKLKESLDINGFETTTLFKARLTRDEIYTAIETLLNSAGQNDRLFIYFSSHGFAEKGNESEGYIATSDCEMESPVVRCVRLRDIGYQAERALTKKGVRQVLIAVDSCFSGLGIIGKAAGPPDVSKLAAAPGAYMLTAGMADQLAQIDPEFKMSTFTHFLARGLSGEAKLLDKNGMITLTELFLYVQYNVAKRTGSNQIPMLGRMFGNGEMLFKPRASPQ